MRINCRIQFNKECGVWICDSTLIAWYPYTGSAITGRYSFAGSALEKPAFRSPVPLHRLCAPRFRSPRVDVVAHSDLVAVVDESGFRAA
ncbi:MAG: hypothetical protein KatS3mg082_0454 [Nitrospiraceae bacterium]|nr:MAG: hypothetical protein KatS3mg082_0454 [Nitrospiraceae bacterium]